MGYRLTRSSSPLAKVERMIRNLPVENPEYWYIDTKSGRLYFGLGRRHDDGCYHGIWAFLRGPGVARDLHFGPNQSLGSVVKALLEDGCQWLISMESRGLLIDGAFRRG